MNIILKIKNKIINMLIKSDGTINTRDIGNYTNLLEKIKSGVLLTSI